MLRTNCLNKRLRSIKMLWKIYIYIYSLVAHQSVFPASENHMTVSLNDLHSIVNAGSKVDIDLSSMLVFLLAYRRVPAWVNSLELVWHRCACIHVDHHSPRYMIHPMLTAEGDIHQGDYYQVCSFYTLNMFVAFELLTKMLTHNLRGQRALL